MGAQCTAYDGIGGSTKFCRKAPSIEEKQCKLTAHKDPDNKAPLPCAFQEPMIALKHMQDGSMAVAEQLETINLSDDPLVQRPISISVHLAKEEKEILVALLKEFRDLFA
ncbi:unnamed protein product [Prunus armeniaca]